MAICAVSEVACLGYHDPIGVLPQERPQRARKCQTDALVLPGTVHDAFQVVFNGSSCE